MPKAARFYKAGEPLKVEEVPIPELKDNQVLVKIRAASICHSDVHITTGIIPVQGPVTLGHEIAGEIVEIGGVGDNTVNASGTPTSSSSTTADKLKKGDRVVIHFLSPCGDCKYCLIGRSNICRNINFTPMYGFSADGGYAQYIVVDSKRLVPLPHDVPFEFGASLGCAGITAVHSVNTIAKVGLGDTVLVYGTGGVGLYVVQLAKLCGASTIISIGRSQDKLEMARSFGADATINTSREKLTDSIKRITNGKGVDVVFDFVVNPESIDNSTKILANLGKLVLVGINSEPIALNSKRTVFKETSIIGTSVGSKEELQLLSSLAQKGKLRSIVNTKYRLDQVNEALNALKEGRIKGRAYFDPQIQ